MEALKELLKKGAIIFAALILTVALIGGIFSAFIASADSSSSSYNGDYEDYINLGEYIVKTDENGAMPALTKEQLKYAIENCYSGQMKENFMSMLDSYIFIQDNYKVNAAFPIAVSIAESSGGTNWDYIDSSTNNIYSIQGKIGGGYQDRNGTWWNVYSSMSEATEKFGELIANNYFTQGKITVSTVGTIYCDPPTAWVNMITPELDKIYSVIAETIPTKGSASGQKILNKAVEIMQYMMDNKYVYRQGNRVPMSNNGKQCDCSTFVCWVLYELGITNCQNNGAQLTTFDMDTNGKGYFVNNGWTKITSYKDLQPGDIVIMSGGGTANGHVQIFAYNKDGKNYYVNCGWDPCDHTSVYDDHQTDFYSAWRAN